MCSESLIMFTMKTLGISLAGRVWLILLYFASTGLCLQRIHCRWGSFGEWSACDPCTKLQSRSRTMVVYAQFNGNLCGGEPNEKRACETTQHCPLGDGCRNRFRCLSGKCISLSLVCNGDQDCEGDSLDEGTCEVRQISCQSAHQTPPNIQNLGVGFDIVTGKERGIVMNTQSFGAQCRNIDGLTTNIVYRVPLSTLSYNYAVKVEKDLSEELFTSHWEYSKKNVYRQTVTGTTTGSTFKDSSEKQSGDKKTTLLVLKSNIEVARFQNQAPQYIPISEAFWKALSGLPAVYDYTAYRAIVERFGTHYRSEGSLGGYLKAFMYVSEDRTTASASISYKYKECDKPKEFALFVPFSRETCSDDEDQTSSRSHDKNDIPLLLKIEVEGGLHITRMYNLDLSEPAKNWIAYSDWADSVISFPVVIKQKLRPLFELVKEVPCAGVKKLHLRMAIEQYDAETHPCHCQPCWNNGLPVREGSKCTCVCKPGTSGLGCQTGSELEGQQGVIHGSWSCWSQWTSCSGNRRSRSRVCSNPSPLNGGLQCIGETSERSECVDQDLEYFRTQEPECFDFSMPPKQKCGPPAVLINGFVLDPKDVYLVGKKLEYRCITGYHLVGNAIIECMEDQTWSQRPGTCEASNCVAAVLTEGVMASPLKGLYRIGEKVTLSCPPGKQILGETEMICDPSLLFSPSPESVRCIEGIIVTARASTAQCQPWEKSSRGKCVCRFPYECMPSLEVCAALTQRGPVLLSVCKLHALQCLGKNHTLIENSFCEWPVRDTADACGSCGIWEACNDQTNTCRCKEASECLGHEVSVCALVGEHDSTPAANMSECEAGRRRCTGEKVTVLSLQPCGPM
ncbi:complement component C7 [Gadus chalcogrammus]|uniref:complement component C7 n=1 Tax=Gadus chalcogrammus TaxID=1042646 RepID=UPI0024C35088|nr:complement component C7 [Gadus chalcogrammus]